VPVLTHGYAHFQPVTDLGPAVIAGISGTGAAAYSSDQYGQPRLLVSNTIWNLLPNAGQNDGSGWQHDLDRCCDAHAAQGFNGIESCVFSDAGNYTDYGGGRTWDGVLPFVSGGDPATGLNNAFWARVDYFVAACARNGITAILNLAYGDANTGASSLAGLSTGQCQAFGTALAARYAAARNILWFFGGDYYGTGSSFDDLLSAILTGLRGGGDAHAVSIENSSESTSRHSLLSGNAVETWGNANAQFNALYIYIQTYYGIRYAYGEASPVPPIWMDGYYYKSGAGPYFGSYDRAMRQYVWWVLSSGGRGVNVASESIYPWDSSGYAELTGEYFFTHTARAIRAAVEALPGWHKLQPDLSNALVTAGGGTPVASDSGTHYGEATTDTFVTASRAPDKSLALIYLSHAATITIDESQLAAGYLAKWIDPDTGTVYAGTPGTTYNSGAADGSKPASNAHGDPDWVLALRAP